jgi:hypothetical protein
MGAGMGVGMGLAMGPAMGQAYGQMASQVQIPTGAQAPPTAAVSPQHDVSAPTSTTNRLDPNERIRLLKELAALKTEGIISQSEFEEEKRKILSS